MAQPYIIVANTQQEERRRGFLDQLFSFAVNLVGLGTIVLVFFVFLTPKENQPEVIRKNITDKFVTQNESKGGGMGTTTIIVGLLIIALLGFIFRKDLEDLLWMASRSRILEEAWQERQKIKGKGGDEIEGSPIQEKNIEETTENENEYKEEEEEEEEDGDDDKAPPKERLYGEYLKKDDKIEEGDLSEEEQKFLGEYEEFAKKVEGVFLEVKNSIDKKIDKSLSDANMAYGNRDKEKQKKHLEESKLWIDELSRVKEMMKEFEMSGSLLSIQLAAEAAPDKNRAITQHISAADSVNMSIKKQYKDLEEAWKRVHNSMVDKEEIDGGENAQMLAHKFYTQQKGDLEFGAWDRNYS